jgi:predicted permease
MTTLREWVSRLWGTVRGNRPDRDLEEELRLHMELASEDARRRGGSPESAVRAASIRSGGTVQAMEALRDQRGLPWLQDLATDLRYGCRMLAKNPGFTLVSVLSLAIGIGANTAVFSFADTLLLRPLTVPRPSEVLTVGSTSPTTTRQVLLASYRDYVDLRDRSRSFEELIAFRDDVVGFASGPDTLPKLTIGMLVTGNFFPAMDVEPELGRAFRPDEDQVPGRDAVVMLGHDFWRREFGADRSIIGRTIRLNGIDFTVIGVTPAGFTGLDQYIRYAFYAPLMMWPRLITDPSVPPFEARDFRSLSVRGRLKPGVTMAQAQTELSVIARDLERAYPDTNRNQNLAVRTELQARIAAAPPIARLLLMLNLLAAAVLFVACANVAGLLASRTPVRAREIAMRLAIGAGRPRIVRQLITESGLIAVIGGVLGLGVGYAGVTLFRQFQIPTDLPIVASFELDRRVLLVSLVAALLSAVMFGLVPAIRSTRGDLTAVMKATDAAGFGPRRRWGRALLVAGQVAVSVVLLVVATFVYRGFQRQLGDGPGFRTDHLLMMNLAPSQLRYSESQAERFFERVAEQARLVPGVQSAALTRFMPMDGLPPSVTIVPEGFQFPAGKESATVARSNVDEHYFDTIGLPILKGRGFRATDSAGAPEVAVVNEVAAQHYWPGQDPIGKRFRLDSRAGPWVEIVGVAKTSKYGFIIERPTEFVYLPYRQRPPESMFLLVRSLGDPASLVAPLRDVVRGLDANLPISNTRTMEELYRMRSVVILNVIVSLIASMGMMGLALALVGLYGLVAYAASRRTKEIGIRMAIGADRPTVLRMVLRQGMGLAIAGLGVGLLASMGADRALRAIFSGGPGGDGRTDVMAFLLVGATVLAITLLAAYLPARRASRVNPTDALRHE